MLKEGLALIPFDIETDRLRKKFLKRYERHFSLLKLKSFNSRIEQVDRDSPEQLFCLSLVSVLAIYVKT